LKGISGRAEDVAIRKQSGLFDIVVSRAVARLNILSELCLPYVKQNGVFLAMKAAKGEEELQEALNGIKKLGGSVVCAHEKVLTLDNGTERRILIEIQKIAPTPPQYPRAYASILKKPL